MRLNLNLNYFLLITKYLHIYKIVRLESIYPKTRLPEMFKANVLNFLSNKLRFTRIRVIITRKIVT